MSLLSQLKGSDYYFRCIHLILRRSISADSLDEIASCVHVYAPLQTTTDKYTVLYFRRFVNTIADTWATRVPGLDKTAMAG